MHLKGTITALITPFTEDRLDEEGLAHNIRFQIQQGVSGILALGTTGESCTLTPDEQQRVIDITVREAKGRVPIWVGTGTYCTRQTIEKTRRAQDSGADIALVVTPYYNRPTQEGIVRHFEAISTSVDIPLVVYNIPGRCGTNIETATLKRLADLPTVVGVKEASGNVNQASDVVHALIRQRPDFAILSGDDALALPMIAVGAHGVISVVSNLIPAQIVSLINAALGNQFNEASTQHQTLLPLFRAAFLETNPIPIKMAMELCGMPAGGCRLPLSELSAEHVHQLRQVLINLNLLPEV